MEGASYLRPHVDWQVLNRKPTLDQVTDVRFVDTDASDDVNTDLPENLTPASKPLTAFVWPCIKDSWEVNMILPEGLAPTIDSNVFMKNWGDGVFCPLIYASDVSQDVLKTNSPYPEVVNIQNAEEEIYTGRAVTRTK